MHKYIKNIKNIESIKIVKAKAVSILVLSLFVGNLLLFPVAEASAASKTKTSKETKISQTVMPIPENQIIAGLSFPGAQAGFILQALGRAYGANFSISSSAASVVVSVEFKNVMFKDALDMIATAGKLSIEKVNERSYLVRLKTEESGDEQQLSEKLKEIKILEKRISDGFVKTFVLNYVGAEDVSKSISSLLGDNAKNICSVAKMGGGGGGGASGSGSGGVSGSSREYNMIVVYAANQKILDYITKVIKEIDKPRPMIEVEAIFAEVSTNTNKDVGIDWSIMPDPIEFIESSIGSVAVKDVASTVPIFNKTSLGQIRRTTGASAKAQVNFAQGSGRGRVLSNPKVRVMSGHVAAFSSETQVPIMNKDSDGEIKTEYKNVGVTLDILPIVLDNDKIYLTVKPTASAITDTVTLGDTQAPQIAERSAETTVLLRDGESIVIGGLLSDRDIKSMSRVPILWKIPLFGELFRSESTTVEHSSLSVYVRLKLIRDYMDDSNSNLLTKEQSEKINSILNKYAKEIPVSNADGKNEGKFNNENYNTQGIIAGVDLKKEEAPKKTTVSIMPEKASDTEKKGSSKGSIDGAAKPKAPSASESKDSKGKSNGVKANTTVQEKHAEGKDSVSVNNEKSTDSKDSKEFAQWKKEFEEDKKEYIQEKEKRQEEKSLKAKEIKSNDIKSVSSSDKQSGSETSNTEDIEKFLY